MTDVAVIPEQLDRSALVLHRASEDVLASAMHLKANRDATAVNGTDHGFSPSAFSARSTEATVGLTQLARELRALGDFVQLTRARMLVADSGGSATGTDPAPGILLQPGAGFGIPDADTPRLGWLDLYTIAGLIDEGGKAPAAIAAIRANGGKLSPAIETLAQIDGEAAGTYKLIGQRARQPISAAVNAMQRTAQGSLWADEAALIGARASVGTARASEMLAKAKSLPGVSAAGRGAGFTLTGVSAALDAKTAVEAFAADDTEKGTLYAIRALGGAATMVPGGQVLGASVVAATYVVEYREELWDGVQSTWDFANDFIEDRVE